MLGSCGKSHHSGPRRRMVGATATVSTFVTVVGHPYRPTLAGNGGFNRGFPCAAVRVVSEYHHSSPYPPLLRSRAKAHAAST